MSQLLPVTNEPQGHSAHGVTVKNAEVACLGVGQYHETQWYGLTLLKIAVWHFIRLFIVYKVFSKKSSNASIYIILQLETEVFGFLTSHTFSCTVTTYKLEIHKWELGDEFRTLRSLAGVGWNR